jgi:hypothetical protein
MNFTLVTNYSPTKLPTKKSSFTAKIDIGTTTHEYNKSATIIHTELERKRKGKKRKKEKGEVE